MQAEVDSDKATPVSPCGWEDDFIEREVLTGEHTNLNRAMCMHLSGP